MLDAAVIFAPVDALVLPALKAVRKGGRVVCVGIHMSDSPTLLYNILWEERELLSVAKWTRQDRPDLLRLVPKIGIKVKTTPYPPIEDNRSLEDLRAGRLEGVSVLIPLR